MSGVGRHRPETSGWCGPERSDYTARRFPPGAESEGLGLDGKGAQPPKTEGNEFSRQAAVMICARDRHRMAETNVPRLRGNRLGSVHGAHRARSGLTGRAKASLDAAEDSF